MTNLLMIQPSAGKTRFQVLQPGVGSLTQAGLASPHISPLTPLSAEHFPIRTGETEKMSETIDNKENTQDPSQEIKIGLSVRASLNVQKVNLIIHVSLIALSFSFLFYGFNHSDVMWRFLAAHIFLPLFIVSIINSACVLYSIYAWTQTSMRYDSSSTLWRYYQYFSSDMSMWMSST